MSKLEKLLPIPEGWLGMLIRWNLETGEFELEAEGPPINYHHLEILLNHVRDSLKDSADKDGMLGKKDTADKDSGTEEKVPPWLKNN